MENNWARRSLDANGFEPGSTTGIGDPSDMHADDPLGDEAAFPTTWQDLACGDSPHD
jgi:hypothetical protein